VAENKESLNNQGLLNHGNPKVKKRVRTMAYKGVIEDFRACTELRGFSKMPVFALGLEFDMRMAGMNYRQARTDVKKMVECQVKAVQTFGYDWAVVFPDDYIEFEPLGLNMRDEIDHPTMPHDYLPMDRDTLARFIIPDPKTEMRLPIHLEMLREVKKKFGDTVCVMGRIAAPFSAMGLIYGIDTLLINMLEDPGLIRDNSSFFIDSQIAFGKAQLEAGADILWFGDCVASSNFIRPEHFSEFAFDAAAKVASALTQMDGLIIYHTCETSLPHLELQVQLPVSAVNVGEGVSISEVKRKLSPKRCLMGNFNPLLLRDGTVEQIEKETEKMVRENLIGGGYAFNTGEGIMHNSPPENVVAMIKTARTTACPSVS